MNLFRIVQSSNDFTQGLQFVRYPSVSRAGLVPTRPTTKVALPKISIGSEELCVRSFLFSSSQFLAAAFNAASS